MNNNKTYDLVCVGGGVMSANLALMIKILNPEKEILILERLPKVAKESSEGWNNAGTGHSALCELNYTPEKQDGTIDISKAIKICKQFEMSKQLWSYLTENGFIENPSDFVMPVKHHSWVLGKDNSEYLEKRFYAFKKHFMFDTIQFTKDIEVMKEWFPLIVEDRGDSDIMAASRIDRGTEVNFGALTVKLFEILKDSFDTTVQVNSNVDKVKKNDAIWELSVTDLKTNQKELIKAKKVFLGAGGGSLHLLQSIGIKESKGYGGFPIGGQWLYCTNEELINKHNAKVYSKAGLGDPPMSTPHLDTRYIDGKKGLLFGPFADFNPKFLKKGSNWDLIKSVRFGNVIPMLQVFFTNFGLTKYLVKQVLMTKSDKVESLQKFMKNANEDDWELLQAGQRVQIIKKNEKGKGILQFGTEVITNEDGAISCLLGASPGASTATAIMLEVIEKVFPEIINTELARSKINEVVPFYAKTMTKELFKSELKRCNQILKL